MNASLKRMTLGQGLAALAAVSLMAAVAPPSLRQLRTRLQPITCANNLRACHQAWSVYGRQYGVWMAPWDRPYPGTPLHEWESSSATWRQWPYTMGVYAAGFSIPDGEAVNYPDGWYTPDGRVFGLDNIMKAIQLQCPTLAMRPPTDPWWHDLTTYSYAVIGCKMQLDGSMIYNMDYYPVPDLMTHPATTVLLHDIGGSMNEGGTNAWTRYGPSFFTIDPHDGKSNYLMCDGHVELLAREALNETMWQSRWVGEDPEP